MFKNFCFYYVLIKQLNYKCTVVLPSESDISFNFSSLQNSSEDNDFVLYGGFYFVAVLFKNNIL